MMVLRGHRRAIAVTGSREGKGAVQKMVPGSAVGSISETVKIRARIPCLIIRPSVVLDSRGTLVLSLAKKASFLGPLSLGDESRKGFLSLTFNPLP